MRYLSGVLFTSGLAALVHGKTVIVNVGAKDDGTPGFAFSPSNVAADMNDIVMFNFSVNGTGHSVTQSTFDKPCQLLENGFDSDIVPVNDTNGAQAWNLTITNQTAPIWFYCKQLNAPSGGPHCTQGMVGAINAQSDGNRSFSNFMNTAKLQNQPDQGSGQKLDGIGASASSPPGPMATGGSGNPSDSGNGNGTDSGNGDGNNNDGNDGGALGLGANLMFSATALLVGLSLA